MKGNKILLCCLEVSRCGEDSRDIIGEFNNTDEIENWLSKNEENFMEAGDGHGYRFYLETDYVILDKKFYTLPEWGKEYYPESIDLEPM